MRFFLPLPLQRLSIVIALSLCTFCLAAATGNVENPFYENLARNAWMNFLFHFIPQLCAHLLYSSKILNFILMKIEISRCFSWQLECTPRYKMRNFAFEAIIIIWNGNSIQLSNFSWILHFFDEKLINLWINISRSCKILIRELIHSPINSIIKAIFIKIFNCMWITGSLINHPPW
jgi:hypothetical protein